MGVVQLAMGERVRRQMDQKERETRGLKHTKNLYEKLTTEESDLLLRSAYAVSVFVSVLSYFSYKDALLHF